MTDKLARWQKDDRKHFLHPFTDHRELAERGTRVITRAKGVYIWEEERPQDPRRHVGPVVRQPGVRPRGAG